MGKILANGICFAKKFSQVFPRQNFALYGSYINFCQCVFDIVALI